MDDATDFIKPFFRFIFGIVKEILLEYLAWYTGWFFYRTLTLGKFPEVSHNQYHEADELICWVVTLTGLVALCAVFGFVIY